LEIFTGYIHIIKDRKNNIYTICHFVAENMIYVVYMLFTYFNISSRLIIPT